MTHSNTHTIETRYRIKDNRIEPLYYKTDGGGFFLMPFIPVYIFCLWLGLLASRRATRWVSPNQVLQ